MKSLSYPPPDEYYLKLREFLRELRLDKGLLQSELAESINKPQSFVSKYEIGEKKLSLYELRIICKFLDTSYIDLLTKFEESIKDET